jgi:Undecaprenyl-phosphate galactose phosphotransferase WbaP
MPSDAHVSSMLHSAEGSLVPHVKHTTFKAGCKRGFDVGFAVLMFVLLLPLMLCICALIRASSSGPIVYRQQRIGKGGKTFMCLKFRTMSPDADRLLQELLQKSPEARREWELSFKLKNDPRITPIGQFLRKTSLDELPQLLNIINGDMSLVGPRPIVASEMARYSNILPLYLSVRPGLTGLWQVSGRSNCTYTERVALDEQYIRTWSLWKDIVIILRTLAVVLNRRGSC